jgi:KipI family sensor histidine kinase inhibitor
VNKDLNTFPRFIPVGEGALLVEFDDVLTSTANWQVRALDLHLQQSSMVGVIEWIPAYSSVLLLYDPRVVQLVDVQHWVNARLAVVSNGFDHDSKRVDVRVRYGGSDGPDLPFVAEYHHLSPAEVIQKHAEPLYYVGMMGFMPGFAYLLGLNPSLATPRLKTPRTHIPAGSVGIAGEQTGVYPLESPGGWQLIGRTEQVLFDPLHEPFFTLSPGDEVRFIPLKD